MNQPYFESFLKEISSSFYKNNQKRKSGGILTFMIIGCPDSGKKEYKKYKVVASFDTKHRP